MGFSFSNLYTKLLGKKFHILMLGLDAAGKTTIVYKLKKDEPITTIPCTHCFGMETYDYKNINFILWDLGEYNKNRMNILWQHYCQNIDGLIFVIDSNDRERIEEAYKNLKELLVEERFKNCPILIMANKQDKNSALTVEEVKEKLCIEILKERTWLVKGISAFSGQGIKEGLDWMISLLK